MAITNPIHDYIFMKIVHLVRFYYHNFHNDYFWDHFSDRFLLQNERVQIYDFDANEHQNAESEKEFEVFVHFSHVHFFHHFHCQIHPK